MVHSHNCAHNAYVGRALSNPVSTHPALEDSCSVMSYRCSSDNTHIDTFRFRSVDKYNMLLSFLNFQTHKNWKINVFLLSYASCLKNVVISLIGKWITMCIWPWYPNYISLTHIKKICICFSWHRALGSVELHSLHLAFGSVEEWEVGEWGGAGHTGVKMYHGPARGDENITGE